MKFFLSKTSPFLMMAFILLSTTQAGADFRQTVMEADHLHDIEAHAKAANLLESALDRTANNTEKAEIAWRLARARLNIGDLAEKNGSSKEQLLSLFEQGEEAAQKAIDTDPSNHLGYFWKSANLGRWGQVKGVLDSLSKAGDMKILLQKAVSLSPGHADSFYVLGQLYEQVPGFPISFGDKDSAVSLGRKAVALHESQLAAGTEEERNFDFYTELAKHLWARNWNASKRSRQQKKKADSYRSEEGVFEKSCFYESAVTLKDLSDRDEAEEMLRWVIGELESLPKRKGNQENDLEEARETLGEWR